jgi:hypothetical protein
MLQQQYNNSKATRMMKARIKGTNTIVECIRIDGFFGEKGKGVYCQYINGEHPGAYETIPGDCLIEIENDFDWQSFRAEAAKDILCAMLGNKRNTDFCPDKIEFSIKYADELIKSLKND